MRKIILSLSTALLASTPAWAINCQVETNCTTLGYTSSKDEGNCLKCPFGNQWACRCTPLPSETGCTNGTTTGDDGCGGIRTICNTCTPKTDKYGLYSCPSSYVTDNDGCGGTYKYCPKKECPYSQSFLYGSGNCFRSPQSGYGNLIGVQLGYKFGNTSLTYGLIIDFNQATPENIPTALPRSRQVLCLGDYPDGLAGSDYYIYNSDCAYQIQWFENGLPGAIYTIPAENWAANYQNNLAALKKVYSDSVINRFYFTQKLSDDSYECYNFGTNETKTITAGDGQICYSVYAGYGNVSLRAGGYSW